MKISELPEPYKSLAESRREKEEFSQLTDWLDEAFFFTNTPEGWHFWTDVHMAQTATELPPIPPETRLLTACKWLVGQIHGWGLDTHLEKFPEYHAALKAIQDAEKAGK